MSRKSNRDSCPRKGGCPEAKVPHSKLMDHNVYEPGVLWAVFNPRSPRGKCNWSEQMKQESVCKRDSHQGGRRTSSPVWHRRNSGWPGDGEFTVEATVSKGLPDSGSSA